MMHQKTPEKIVLAYSGGLDTSVMLRWLIEKYQCPVIAFAADVGQDEDLKALEKKALQTGATEVFVEDLRDEFVREYVFAALKANAVYEGSYLMGTALARPLIAVAQVKLAQRLGAQAVAHGATGKGNDQVRFELTYQALAPHLDIIAPWREWEFASRSDLIEYARRQGIEVSATVEKPYSIDRNLMHVSYEGGILEDPWLEPPEDMFTMTRTPERAPEEAAYLLVDFEKGVPVALNEQTLEPVALLEAANRLAGRHGIGRVDLVENRFVGIKSRGVYETPGMTLLHTAHRAIESITLDREILHLRDSLQQKVSELIYYGFWFSPEFELLRGFLDASQKNVTGTVRMKLFKGICQAVGRRSPVSLYSQAQATFEEDFQYQPKDAEGFIRLNALRLRSRQEPGEQRQGDKPLKGYSG